MAMAMAMTMLFVEHLKEKKQREERLFAIKERTRMEKMKRESPFVL